MYQTGLTFRSLKYPLTSESDTEMVSSPGICKVRSPATASRSHDGARNCNGWSRLRAVLPAEVRRRHPQHRQDVPGGTHGVLGSNVTSGVTANSLARRYCSAQRACATRVRSVLARTHSGKVRVIRLSKHRQIVSASSSAAISAPHGIETHGFKLAGVAIVVPVGSV